MYRYEKINILGTCYFVVLDSTLGAQWVHDPSVHLIFPAGPEHVFNFGWIKRFK